MQALFAELLGQDDELRQFAHDNWEQMGMDGVPATDRSDKKDGDRSDKKDGEDGEKPEDGGEPDGDALADGGELV